MAYPDLAKATVGDKTITVWHDQDTEEPYLEHVEFKRLDRRGYQNYAYDDESMMDTCEDCGGFGELEDGAQCDVCRGNGEIPVVGVLIWPVSVYDYGANGLRAVLSDYDPVHNNTVSRPNGLLVIDGLSEFADWYGQPGKGVDFEGLFTTFLNEWTQWASGECYGYTITTPQVCAMCGHDEPELVDSCGGYIGIDWLIAHLNEEETIDLTEGDLEWQ